MIYGHALGNPSVMKLPDDVVSPVNLVPVSGEDPIAFGVPGARYIAHLDSICITSNPPKTRRTALVVL